MEEVRLFKIIFGGIWEEGPPHIFPVRKFKPVTFENSKMLPGEWVDAGMSEFPSFKYVGGKSIASRVPWDGDTTSIIELNQWIQNGVPEFVNNLIRIYWLWGKQRYELTKDVDLIYFWHHAPVNVDGFTEIIIDAEPVIPLAFDATNATETLKKATNVEEIIDLTLDAETTDAVDAGDVDAGYVDAGDVDVDYGVETSTNHEEDARDVDGESTEEAFAGVETSTNHGEDGEATEEAFSGVEASTDHGEDEQHDEAQINEEPVNVQFLGKKFNLDKLDAEDEEYLSAESSEEEIEPNEDDEVLKRKAAKTSQEPSNRVDGEGPSNRVDGEGPTNMVEEEIDGEDGDFIRKTDMLEEDDCVAGNEESLTLEVNQTWMDIYACRKYLRDYAIRNKFEFKYRKNDSDKLKLICKQAPLCNWRVLVSRSNNKHTMECRKIEGRHTCIGDITDKNKMATAPWIASKIEQEMRMHYKTFKPSDIQEVMRHKHHVTVTYWQAWHARILALELLFGNFEESFAQVPELCRQIQLANPGSIAAYSRDHLTGTFTSLTISFKASIDGFINGCRPLLGIDGCFLKGKYGGACLTMIALDGNNGMFPVAYYIGLSEDTLNWRRFLENMYPYVSRHPDPLTFMSYRQKGLIEAVSEVFPNSYQRFCFRHMVKNLRIKYRGVDHIVWAAARAYRESDFQRHMDELKQMDKNAANYMVVEPAGLWARAYFNVKACSDHNTNNFTECFNSYILEARDKPIVSLVLKIQTLLMKLIFHRDNLCIGWNDNGLVPRVEKELQKLEAMTFEYDVAGASAFVFQVDHKKSGQWFIVDLETKQCNCKKWQLTGIPCVHVVAVLYPRRIPYVEYTHPYFTVAAYKRAYQGYIRPTNHLSEWQKVSLDALNVLPPITKRQPGRNRKQRRIDAFEAEISGKRRNEKRCRRCGEFGHNSTTCKNEPEQDRDQTRPVEQVQINKGGRPRIRPQKIVWDPETGTTKVLANMRTGTGVTAKERAEKLQAAKLAAKAAKATKVSVGRGRGRGNASATATATIRRGTGRSNATATASVGRGRGRDNATASVGRGRGRDNATATASVGRGRGRGRSKANATATATQPSTPPPMEDVTPQSQPTQPEFK